MRVLVTGCYGFLGHHVCARLIAAGHDVTGTDRLSTAISEKGERIKVLGKEWTDARGGTFRFVEVDLASYDSVRVLVETLRPEVVIHLAAQFPVRHCAAANASYVASNVAGWLNVAEACRVAGVPRMIYASSIVAFGRPSSMYAATKGFNDLAAQVYAGQFGMTMVGLRYAAIYGPRIRPDAAAYRIARQMLAGKMLDGRRLDSSTLMIEITDAVECTRLFVDAPLAVGAYRHLVAADDDKASSADVAVALARHLKVPAVFPPGYTPKPRSGRPDLSALHAAIGFTPKITMTEGMGRFAEWLLRK